MKLPREVQQFAALFSELPGVGPRQALRLAFFFLHKGQEYQVSFAEAVRSLKHVRACRTCSFAHTNEDGLCDICRDQGRDKGVIAIVEKETDVISLEGSGVLSSRYMVLGSSRRSGVFDESQRKRLAYLKEQIKSLPGGIAKEIIIAVNPTTAGDMTAAFLVEEMSPYAERVTRLGRGIPTGGEIEFSDEETLKEALTRRK